MTNLWHQLVELILSQQVAITAFLTTAIMWGLSRVSPKVADLANSAKVVITAAAAAIVSVVVGLLGGTPDDALSLANILLGGGLAFATATGMFKMAKTQPSNAMQQAHLADTGALPARKF